MGVRVTGTFSDLTNFKAGKYVVTNPLFDWTNVITTQSLAPSGASELYGRGMDISADGLTLAVGAPQDNSYRGAVYVYVRADFVSDWQLEQKIIASNNLQWNQLGQRVSLSADGNVLAASQIGHDDTISDQGGAVIFNRSAGVWSEIETVIAIAPAGGIGFPNDVRLSLDASILMLGSPSQSLDGDAQAGRVFYYEKQANSYVAQNTLTASSPLPSDGFGITIGISESNDVAVIGCPQWYNSVPRVGRAFVFERSGSTWTEQQILTGSDPSTDWYGASVDISSDGSTIVVAAPAETGFDGAAYVYRKSGGTWQEVQHIDPNVATNEWRFGKVIRTNFDGSFIAIYDEELNTHIFQETSPNTWTQVNTLVFGTGNQPIMNDNMAFAKNSSAVAASYDVDSTEGSQAGAVKTFAADTY